MIRVYYLPVERIDNTDKVKGSEYIHNALLNCTKWPDIRELIQDTTPEEDIALTALAIEVREPTPEELAQFEALPKPPEPTPSMSTHPARIDAINPGAIKPATVTRIFLTEDGFTTLWNGKEWQYDCYVSQSVVDEWQAGKIAVGDFVLIEFLEGDVTKPLLTLRIYRSWGG